MAAPSCLASGVDHCLSGSSPLSASRRDLVEEKVRTETPRLEVKPREDGEETEENKEFDCTNLRPTALRSARGAADLILDGEKVYPPYRRRIWASRCYQVQDEVGDGG